MPASLVAVLAAAGAAGAQQDSAQGQDDFTRALEQELADRPPAATQAPPGLDLFGGARLQLLDLSLDVLFAAGGSSEQDDALETLQGGGHDPHQRGFNVQNVELSLTGAVDPYADLEAHLIYFVDAEGESQFELEEAYFTTRTLPWSLQLKGGHYFTEFGRINAQHPHQWDFVDQPVISTRLFGPDGMRGPGARLAWLAPLPWFSELQLSLQNADGETMTSFLGTDEEENPGGHVVEDRTTRSLADFAWVARFAQSWDVRDDVVTQLGFSGAWGPNSSGSDTSSAIYGGDLRVKWQPRTNDAGWPFVIWQTEVMRRIYGADLQSVDPDGVPASGDEFVVDGDTLRDTGLYTYLLWGFRREWGVGLRYEYATASGDAFTPRDDDPFRDDRHRVSPLVTWQPTHVSRYRLQYNFDRAEHLQHERAHSVWLGVEFLIGSHPVHKY